MKNYNYHYVYRITNTVTGYHYYGSKSCDEQPKENIGIKYFSSSSNKLFIQDQKNNPQDYKYKVVKEFKTCRIDATAFEIKLHIKFDVKNHPRFINKVNQTSKKFDTTGIDFRNGKTIAVFDIIENKHKFVSDKEFDPKKHIHNAKGKRTIIDKVTGFTKQINKDDFDMMQHKHNTQGMTTVIDLSTGERKYVETHELYTNKSYESIFKKTITVYDIDLKKNRRVSLDEFNSFPKRYISTVKGRITAYDIKTKEYKSIMKEEYNNNLNYVNRNSKIIKIFNKNSELVFVCIGTFKNVCLENNLPKQALTDSFNNGGKPLYSTKHGISKARRFGFDKYEGWYAIKEEK